MKELPEEPREELKEELKEELRARILSVRDVEVLQKLLKIAARTDSIEAFEKLSEL